jgi:hypothetical protein
VADFSRLGVADIVHVDASDASYWHISPMMFVNEDGDSIREHIFELNVIEGRSINRVDGDPLLKPCPCKIKVMQQILIRFRFSVPFLYMD